MARFIQSLTVWAILIGVVLSARLLAQEATEKPAEKSEAVKPAASKPANEDVSLAIEQEIIKKRFERFFDTMNQMSEYMRKTDPERADLLIRAIGQSQDDGISEQMAREEDARFTISGSTPPAPQCPSSEGLSTASPG